MSVLPLEHFETMKTLFLVVMLLFLFAGSGFCLGGAGGGLTGLILLNCIGLHLTGGFRIQSKRDEMTANYAKDANRLVSKPRTDPFTL